MSKVGDSVLMMALIKNAPTEVVQLLLENKADTTAINEVVISFS
jgi:ankyrin repeat protein